MQQLGLGTQADLARDLVFQGISATLAVDAEAVGYKGLLALMMRIEEEVSKHAMKGYLFFGDFDTDPDVEAIPETGGESTKRKAKKKKKKRHS